MDFEKLAADLIGIVKAAAPLVGLSDEVEAAERLLASATSAYETIKGALGSDDQVTLEAHCRQDSSCRSERPPSRSRRRVLF